MGAVCCIGSAACCAGQICCSSMCCLCKACGIQPKNFPKISYALFDLFWVGIAILLMFTLGPLFEKYSDYLHCNEESGGGSACFGTAAVLRMSFTLFIFHFIILLVTIPRLQCSSAFHDGCWPVKFLFVIGVYIAVFWIPNEFYYGWAHFCRIVSGLYLVIQVLLLIIIAFTINDVLVKSYENGNTCASVTLIGLTAIFTLGTIAFLILQYIWFHGCAGPIVIITFTLVFMIVFFVLNIIKTRSDGSIFTASVVSSYIAYVGWSAMASMPDEECNPFVYSTGNLVSQIVVGGCFTFVCLIAISAMSASSSSKASVKDQKMVGETAKSIIAEDEEESKPQNLENVEVKGKTVSAEEAAIFPITKQTMAFQGIMLLATLYYPMLITNWGDPVINSEKSNFFQSNWISFWVKISSQWVCILIYLWALLAPIICKGRDFY